MEYEERYNQTWAAQERMFELYNIIMLTEARGFTMTAFAYALLTIFKEGN